LKKQRKSISKKWNDTEERNDAFQNDTQKRRQKNNNAHQINGKDLSIGTLKEQHSRNEQRFQKKEKWCAATNTSKTSAFQNDTQKNDARNDAQGDSQTTSKDLKNYRIFNKRN
jgi:hypothetical protein